MTFSTLSKLSFCFFALGIASCNSTKTNKTISTETSKTITSKKPNILMVLCDDLGYSDVGFNGSKDITTPALDKLANNGTIFTSAYVAHPFCGPSRASLMTGVYSHTIGAQFNLPPNSETIGQGISLKEPFISKSLDQAGYYTGLIGKWHLGANPEFHPNVRGFDDFYGFLGGGHNYFPEQYKAAYKKQKENGRDVIWDYLSPLEHNGNLVNETEYLTDAFSREAVRFINEAAQKEDPFFLYLSYNAPHTPLQAKEEDMQKFSNIKDKKRRTYAAMVYAVDRGIEKITQALKDSGQLDNTLIVFFSDNGGKTKAGATNFPLKEGKGSVFEGGHRVPMFFHWPNVVPAGQKFDHLVSVLDLYPTFLRLAEAPVPAGKKLDGRNIWDNFLEGKNSHENDNLYIMRHRNGFSDVSVRRNEWKAVKAYQQKWKLFNIEKDMSEDIDLSSQHPDIIKELVDEGKNWSETHVQPLWWHDVQTGEEWKTDAMPHFNKTFSLD